MAVGEGLVQVRISLLQLWLGASLVLSGWPQIGHAQHHRPPEVVIPLKVIGNSRGMRTSGWLTYSLHFGGQRHIVHMKAKKFLISRHFSVFSYTEQGALIEDRPFVQNDCYYHGYVEGDPESLVALSTCFGGFQGTLQINDILYEIKPKIYSATFEHLVYKMDSEETELAPMKCGLTEEEIARHLKLQESDNSTLMQSGYVGWWTHSWLIELVLVIDHNRFLHRESNISNVVQEAVAIVNEINFFLSALDVNVVLIGLEIWNAGNPMPMKDISVLLSDFCKWKVNNLNSRIPHDIAHLFANHNFGINLGLAYMSTVCNPRYSCGVDRIMGDDVHKFGHIVAHELGHNLGMDHDDRFCTCGKGLCVMAPKENSSVKFSNCSYAALYSTATRTNCLRNAPNPSDIFTWKFCGNGVIEQGEECDCGSLKLCTRDPCCLPSCTLKSGANCSSGLCCKDCQFSPSGTVCREKEGECDLPEWCNGTWYECPEDVYVQDGTPCKGSGYCYEKRCNDHDEQCRQMFGQGARSATQSCYKKMNTRGDRFGNCGITSTTYVRCNISDVLCGRVQCENVKELPFLREHSTVHWTHLNGVTCWGTDYHWGMTIPDVGEVKDGTGCGLEHVCMRRKCVHKSVWKSDCSQKTCNLKGVCNNKHHCHCKFGWATPNCSVEGLGGSVDSGPPPEKQQEEELLKSNLLALLFWIPVWILLLILIILLLMRLKKTPANKVPSVPTSPKQTVKLKNFPTSSNKTTKSRNFSTSSKITAKSQNFATSSKKTAKLQNFATASKKSTQSKKN